MDSSGPAFPVTPTNAAGQTADTQLGMTKRDWFAGQALIGEMFRGGEDIEWKPKAALIAETCYKLADAMLAEREKGGSG